MTSIEWTECTWNPVTGCDRVSPGCAHCYALDLAARLKGMGQAKYQRDGDPRTSGPGFGVTLHPNTLDEPRRRRKPTMYFVNSMSDLFHEEIPDDYIRRVWRVMRDCHRHTFQILTKRPERMREWVAEHVYGPAEFGDWTLTEMGGGVVPNIWLGVSIENRRYVSRADVLRYTPAAVRFISAEPLLGPLVYDFPEAGGRARGLPVNFDWHDEGYKGPELDLAGIGWLIAGGESGPKHRPMDAGWVRDLRDVCEHEGVAFFFKQWGGRTPKAGGRELDGRTWDEMPARVSVA